MSAWVFHDNFSKPIWKSLNQFIFIHGFMKTRQKVQKEGFKLPHWRHYPQEIYWVRGPCGASPRNASCYKRRIIIQLVTYTYSQPRQLAASPPRGERGRRPCSYHPQGSSPPFGWPPGRFASNRLCYQCRIRIFYAYPSLPNLSLEDFYPSTL